MKNVCVGLALALAATLSAGCADDTAPATPGVDGGDVQIVDSGAPADVGTPLPDVGAADVADALADVGAPEDVGADVAPDVAEGLDVAPDTADVPPEPFGLVKELESDDELIGGIAAVGQVGGGWLLANDHAKFIVQGSNVAAGLDLYGGNLVDVDVVRGPGEPGNDRFREMFPIVGFRVPTAESVTVLDDGQSGEQVALRVTGTDDRSRILDILDSLVGQPYGFVIHTDYILHRDVAGVLIRTTIENPTETGYEEGVMVGDLLSFGKMMQLFYPESGFGDPKYGLVTRIVGRGDGVSYGYARPEGTFLLPLVDASGTGALYEDGVPMTAGGSGSFERWFVVGTGDIASVMAQIDAVRGDPTFRVEGMVTELATGEAVAGVDVTALTGEGDESHAVNQATTWEDGSYRMTLPPGGEYTLVVSGAGRPHSDPVAVPLVVEPDEQITADLEVAAPGFLSLDIDGPARVYLAAKSGVPRDERLGETNRTAGDRPVFTHDGLGVFPVLPGEYTVTVSRGPEFEAVVKTLTISEAQTTTLTATLARVVDTTGWVSGDFHLHSVGSLDSEMHLDEKVTELVAAGVEVAAATDHDNVTDYGPVVDALSVGHLIHSIVGDEISVNGVGHFNAYPLPLDPDDPFALVGAKLWADKTIQELFDHVHDVAPEAVIQINHPRSSNFMGYFNWIAMDPVAGDSTSEDRPMAEGFDGIEVNSEIGSVEQFLPEADAAMTKGGVNNSGGVPVMRDWFGLLGRGMPIAGLGNSDSHDYDDRAGYPRTYLGVGTDDPALVTDEMVEAAIKAQRVVVSRGIFMDVTTGGEQHMGHADPVTVAEDGTVELTVRIQAPPWVGVDRLEVYENGRPLTLAEGEGGVLVPTDSAPLFVPVVASEEVERLTATVRVAPTEDAWYVFVAKGAGTALTVFGGPSYAYTNPIYVHAVAP